VIRIDYMKTLFPGRADYNKSLSKYKKCFFCDASVIKNQECTAFQFHHWIVLVNKNPYMDGNVMLIPKEHKTRLAQLSSTEWEEFPQALLDIQKMLTKLFKTHSFNIGINIGKQSGQSVAHLHWQIIPRKRKNHTVIGVLADIQTITLPPKELKETLSK